MVKVFLSLLEITDALFKPLGSKKSGVMLHTLTIPGFVTFKFPLLFLIQEIMLSLLMFMVRMQAMKFNI